MNSIAAPGDFNGDRKADLTARDANGQPLPLPRQRNRQASSASTQIGTGWNTMNAIM